MMKLVEEYAGVGDLSTQDDVLGRVRYRIARYQGMHDVSGVPVPGVHRIEGSLDAVQSVDFAPLVGKSLVLRLEDGRALGITLANDDGRVLAEGHGPMKCLCC
ncbi:MAG TPA: hypothetical protein VFB85_22415 [Vicinamibacterales bacterium]|jgi:hypothetical protein|nr:hypothetical protein [Vicinamibacterales bacterium]